MRKALYILGILDDNDVSWLATTGKAQSISGGTVIIQQGVPVDSVLSFWMGSSRSTQKVLRLPR